MTAKSKTAADQSAAEQAKEKTEAVKKTGTEYSVQEFAAASQQVFGKEITPDIVIAAFRVNNVTSATKETAIKLVTEFSKKEVE